MTHQSSQLASRSRGQPDAGQVVDANQIGQELSIAEVGLVGRPFHSVDVAWVSQPHGQLALGCQFFGQIGCAAARLDGDSPRRPISRDDLLDGLRVVFDSTIAQLIPFSIEQPDTASRCLC